ncbi:MAG: hypothetical protein ABS939_08515 [Psychrobacillus sp.]
MTALAEVYDSFLSAISDYSFLSEDITEEEINEELFDYFKKARTKFYRCKNSLKLDKSEDGEVFTVELHPMEIEVLSTLMLAEYVKHKMIATETLSQSLSDKDFKIYSQASQLREIRLLYSRLKSDASKLITEYTYLELDLNGDGKSDYEQ